MSLPKTTNAPRSGGTAAAYPSVYSRRQAVEEEVGRPWRLRAAGRPTGSSRHQYAAAWVAERPANRRRRIASRYASRAMSASIGSNRRRREQQRRCIAAATASRTRARRGPDRACLLDFVHRAIFRDGQELLRASGAPASNLGCRRGEGAPAARRRIGRQHGSPFQERGRRRDPPRACARSAECSSSVAISSSGPIVAAREMPCPPVGIDLRIGRLGQRLMGALSFGLGCGDIDRGTHQRVAEPDPPPQLDQSGRLGRRRGLGAEAEPARPPARAATRRPPARPRRSAATAGFRRQRVEPAQEALLDPARQRRRVGPAEPARQFARCQTARQFEQGERIAARLRDDPVADELVHAAGESRVEQCPGVAVAETTDHEFGQPGQLRNGTRLPDGEYQSRPAPRASGGRRTRASAPTPGPAIENRRPPRGAAAPRRPSRGGRARPDRPRIDPEPAPRRGRRPPRSRPAAGRAAARADAGTGRTADAGPRRRVLSRTRGRPLGRYDSPTRCASDSRATPTCRPRPRRARRSPDSDSFGRSSAVGPGRRTRRVDRAARGSSTW